MGIVKMTVHEVAKLTGITNRTLHYYDEIGLLTPSIVTETKYRIYTNEDLGRLQEILFFKEIGFSLKEIKELLSCSFYNREEALTNHLKILELKKKRIDKLIGLVNDTISGTSSFSFEAFSDHEILEAQAWKDYISENFYPCSFEMLSYLGQLYISDDRFSEYIDRFGTGLSAFFQKAIKHYCENNSDTHGK